MVALNQVNLWHLVNMQVFRPQTHSFRFSRSVGGAESVNEANIQAINTNAAIPVAIFLVTFIYKM